MAHAIRLYEIGGPDVLRYEQVEVGAPGPGQARVRHTYVAVNFIDIYHRTGRYPLALPNGLGSDAVGVVEAVGEGVTCVKPGDRVGYLFGPQGAYADVRVLPADVLIPLPEGISDRSASTLMMKGLTAQYLFRQVFPLHGGETILYHAAAGGVGLLACQWARALGVTMIGTVSTEEKAEVARANGCTHTIVTGGMSAQDLAREIPRRVRELTDGKGVPVVYDSVGQDTLMASLDSLKVRGTLVSNGTTSGPVVIDTMLLAVKGSIWITRPAMVHYAAPRASMLAMADELFAHVYCPAASPASPSRNSHSRKRPTPTAPSSRAAPPAPRCWCPEARAPKQGKRRHPKCTTLLPKRCRNRTATCSAPAPPGSPSP